MFDPTDLYSEPNALATSYSRFRVAERLLLTGHSHQAWPDCAREAVIRAFDDAAELVDRKWDRAFAMAERVQRGFAELLDDPAGSYALGVNTHELLVRWLSALPLADRPRLVTTDGEFHTIRRQLRRLEEEGVEVVRVSAEDPARVAELLLAALDERTSAVLVSSVLFRTGRRVNGLGEVLAAAQHQGAELLVDCYHSLNVVPLSLREAELEGAYVTGGGYKYCQLGEGNCFLRLPPDCRLRPVITGWFAEFAELGQTPDGEILYGDGAVRFAGSTYDPVSHYRAAAVLDFFVEKGLDQRLLRQVSQHQIGVLRDAFDRLDVDPRLAHREPDVELSELGGFLVIDSPHAADLSAALYRRGVATDSRGSSLRFGPAPYLSDRQLRDAMGQLGEALTELPTA